MKTHFKQVGTFLLYTLVFNIISFIGYFLPAFFSHNFGGPVWIVFGIFQIFFTVLFFKNVPLKKTSDEKSIKIDLLLYFMILSVISIFAAYIRWETAGWFSFIFFNTFYTFTVTSLLDNIKVYICVYIIENVIKTYCLYRNIRGKSFSEKAIAVSVYVLNILYIVYFVFMLEK